MLLGIWEPGQLAADLRSETMSRVAQFYPDAVVETARRWCDTHLLLCHLATPWVTATAPYSFFTLPGPQVSVMAEGTFYNLPDLQAQLGLPGASDPLKPAQALALLYQTYGHHFLDPINGKFSFALWDKSQQRLILGQDRLGIQPLFYCQQGDRLVFSSALKAFKALGIKRQLNRSALLQYLLYCYNPGNDTLLQDIHRLPAAHFLSWQDATATRHQYWQLSFAHPQAKTEAQYCEEIPQLIKDAVRIRMTGDRPLGIFLSGGIDSSAMLSFASQLSDTPLSTFSFRCDGRSYDESSYARYVAEHFGTNHTEIPYQPSDLTSLTAVVGEMDEPFCDLGIEISTFLMGRAAQNQVAYVFSGEGGDELFGGHPVYSADKVAAVLDTIPRPLLNPFLQILQRLPDSTEKKNLQVKLKRFSYSLTFPPELLSHRWRAYYSPQELLALCSATFLNSTPLDRLFENMIRHSRAADGPDALSRSLYSDYWTLVSFYLRRLSLLKAFGIDSRVPLLDYRLIEYAATVPSNLKISGFSDTKYIYKKALVGTIPDKILFDRPKLGHSVPLKNWLRNSPQLREWVVDLLSSSAFCGRDLFQVSFVQKLIQEHLDLIHNHSHRLWALVVLESWLQKNLDE